MTKRMLVKALKLYDRDVKLTKVQLQAQAPMVGILRYEDAQYAGLRRAGASEVPADARRQGQHHPAVRVVLGDGQD